MKEQNKKIIEKDEEINNIISQQLDYKCLMNFYEDLVEKQIIEV